MYGIKNDNFINPNTVPEFFDLVYGNNRFMKIKHKKRHLILLTKTVGIGAVNFCHNPEKRFIHLTKELKMFLPVPVFNIQDSVHNYRISSISARLLTVMNLLLSVSS